MSRKEIKAYVDESIKERFQKACKKNYERESEVLRRFARDYAKENGE